MQLILKIVGANLHPQPTQKNRLKRLQALAAAKLDALATD